MARDEDLAEQIGKDIYFDLVDHDKVRSFRVQKQLSFNLFKVSSSSISTPARSVLTFNLAFANYLCLF